MFELLTLLAIWAIVGPALGLIFVLRQRILHNNLRRQVGALSQAQARMAAELAALRALPPQVAPAPAVPEPVLAEAAMASVPVVALAASPSETAEAAAPPRPRRETMEQRLTSRWMLWLGALTLALGGVFLVKYSVDMGLLGPRTRVSAGFLFGCALMAAGEWARRAAARAETAPARPDYVPPALSAAGVSIAYTSLFAAFQLYHLLGPLAAFLLLGAVSIGAVLLAVPQGPLVALLGVVGGFATPLLVPSTHPSAWGLFLYLLGLTAAGLAMVRATGAIWLGAVTLAGALAWPALWLLTYFRPGEAGVVGAYLLGLAALGVFVPAPALLAVDAPGLGLRVPRPAALVAWIATALIGVLVYALLRMDLYGATALAVLGLFAGFCLFVAWRAPGFDALGLLAEAVTLAAIATWYMPQLIALGPMVETYLPLSVETTLRAGPGTTVLLPQLGRFLSAAAGFAALFGGAGFVLHRDARRPGIWGALSASAPVLLLAVAYGRVVDFQVTLRWGAVGLALAGANVVAAGRVRRESGPPVVLAAYAAGAVAALSLGATMVLREAWLTVALSVQLPALAWIAGRLSLPALRRVAWAVALVVLVRLVGNPDLFLYRIGTTPLLNWILYGYGVPAAAFYAAARWFRRDGDDRLVRLLEGGALAFAALLATLEIHELLLGPPGGPSHGLLEASLQTIVWLAMAIGLGASPGLAARPVALWGRRVLSGLAVGRIVLWQLLLHNPLWSGEKVGHLPVLNLLLLAYGVPAALLAVQLSRAPGGRMWAWVRRGLLLVLLFTEVSLEVRRGFHGSVLSRGPTSDAEWYSYSAAWLAFAGLLLAVGLRGGSVALRYGALGVLLVVVGKVFISDMAALTGLFRVASFFGLGLCLIGVGYLYQRVVFPPARGPDRPA